MKKVNTLKFHYYKDESAKPILEKISKYTQQAETMQIPYWVFAQNSNPIGLVALGKEPVQLLAPPGTPMALIYLICLRSAKTCSSKKQHRIRISHILFKGRGSRKPVQKDRFPRFRRLLQNDLPA